MDTQKIAYAQNYTKKEYLLRFLWFVGKYFFRYSPRIFYEWRNVILRVFGAKIGKGVKIYPSADIMFPWNLTIGNFTVISWRVIIYNLGQITIGSNTIISQHAHLCAGTHDYRSPSFDLLKSQIHIGDQVWIAADAFIGPEVQIEHRSVIAARAVIVKNVESGVVMAGNPAKAVSRLS